MKAIHALIVEDRKASRVTIQKGIDNYNRQDTGFEVVVLGEFEAYVDAKSYITSMKDSIHLIFLDITLKGKGSGMDLCREFPDIAYIVVSKDIKYAAAIPNETDAQYYFYITKAAKGAFDSGDIAIAVNKYIGKRGNDIYPSLVKLGRRDEFAKDINFISRSPLCVRVDKGMRKIEKCETCLSRDWEGLSAIQATVDSSVDHNCLLQLYKTENTESSRGNTLSSFIEVHDLNPAYYSYISPSTIADVRKIRYVKGRQLIFDIGEGSTAIFESDPAHVKQIVEKLKLLRQ